MNTTVFKYELRFGETCVDLPEGSEIVLTGEQNGNYFIWARVPTPFPEVTYSMRRFRVFATGEVIPHGWSHVGSFQDPPYVWHVFRRDK